MNAFDTVSSTPIYKGRIFEVAIDRVEMPGGTIEQRDVVKHLDAVAVVALNTEGEVALIKQYRHPMKDFILELPAGLMDKEGETPFDTALRELQEETGVIAKKIRPLVTIASSPGFTDELVEVYLATDLIWGPRPVGADDEESQIEVSWVNLVKAVDMIWDRRIISAHTVAGLLAVFSQGALTEMEL